MHIALISYEFPPETAYGGIGTYTYQLANALAARGHDIEVFSSSPSETQNYISLQRRLLLHKVLAGKRSSFNKAIVAIFEERHAIYPFDVVESPEFGAEGTGIKNAFPLLPFTVKLHAPFFLYNRFNKHENKKSLYAYAKTVAKKWLRYNDYNRDNDKEYQLATAAHSVCTPSRFLAGTLQREWKLTNIKVVPNFYQPNIELLSLPIQKHSKKIVAFIGRLEKLKGIHNVLKAIPGILKKHPDVIFRFIGNPGLAPDGITRMDTYMLDTLGNNNTCIEFAGYVPADKLANALADVSVVMIPSLFENFPYVGLESMAAGKAVIVSANSGMPEMFPAGEQGCIVINPTKPAALSNAVSKLLSSPYLCLQMGSANRQHVVQHFATDRLLDDVIHFYKDTIMLANIERAVARP